MGIYESEVLFVYAIIVTGGKQYKVSEGDEIFVEKLDAEEGAKALQGKEERKEKTRSQTAVYQS